MTQVFNRNVFSRLLEKTLISQHDGVALVILDIDHFKQFNDQYGHPLGDRVLQHVGQVLRETLPAHGIAARYDGEEFCIILRDCFDAETAHAFAYQLRLKTQSLRIKVRSTDQVLNSITASFGYALYQAKRDGRNKVSPTLDEAAGSR